MADTKQQTPAESKAGTTNQGATTPTPDKSGNTSKQSNRGNHRRGFNGKRGGRNSGKDNRNLDKKLDDIFKGMKDPTQDPAWYMKNPIASQAVGNFTHNLSNGIRVTQTGYIRYWGHGSGDDYASYATDFVSQSYLPGFMIYHMVPTFPESTQMSGADLLTLVGNKHYTFTRHQNSGSANYEQSDMMQNIIVLLTQFELYAELTRLYAIAKMWPYENRYMALALLDALTYNKGTDILTHMPQLLNGINILAHILSSYKIPKDLPVAERYMMLGSSIFRDSDDAKAPLHLCVFDVGFSMPDVDGTINTRMGLADLLDDEGSIEAALASIIAYATSIAADEDFNIIMGDVLKAYGSENCVTIKPITADYSISITTDDHFLNQIDNAYVPGLRNASADYKITQENNVLKPQLSFTVARPSNSAGQVVHGSVRYMNEYMMKGFKQDLGPGDVLVATRLMPILKAVPDASNMKVTVESCGTEIITGAELVTYYTSNTNERSIESLTFTSDLIVDLNPLRSVTLKDEMLVLTRLDKVLKAFNHHPRLSYEYAYYDNGNNVSFGFTNFFDIDPENYYIMSKSNLEACHYVAGLSVYNYTNADRI